ncbi:MAG: hypothetical protein ABJC12_10845 [Saprospiraceae bacterium]
MKFIITLKWSFLSVLIFLLAISCHSDKATNIPDVSDIHVDLNVTRFDQLLLGDTTMDAVRLQKLMDQYPAFSRIFFNQIMPTEGDIRINTDQETRLQNILTWMRQPSTRWLYDTVQQILPKLDKVEKDLQSAFTYAKYYFPDKKTPRVFTTISDFGYFPFIYAEDSLSDGLGISLEMFLGEKFPYLKYTGLNNAFSDYLTRSYNKDHIVKRTLEVWVDDLVGQPEGEKLLDIIINNGKKLFILKSLLPEVNDTVIMDYSLTKLEWARDNERNIWQQLSAQDMLYETSMRKIQKLVGPSPSSPGMPPQSPGNTGSWIGWQIVKAYMAKHPETTLPQLIAMKDAQKILEESGYKPPR